MLQQSEAGFLDQKVGDPECLAVQPFARHLDCTNVWVNNWGGHLDSVADNQADIQTDGF